MLLWQQWHFKMAAKFHIYLANKFGATKCFRCEWTINERCSKKFCTDNFFMLRSTVHFLQISKIVSSEFFLNFSHLLSLQNEIIWWKKKLGVTQLVCKIKGKNAIWQSSWNVIIALATVCRHILKITIRSPNIHKTLHVF